MFASRVVVAGTELAVVAIGLAAVVIGLLLASSGVIELPLVVVFAIVVASIVLVVV